MRPSGDISVEAIKRKYRVIKPEIEKRLEEFRSAGRGCERDVFAELCFCLLTPQSKALVCDGIIRKLKESNLLYEGSAEQIRPHVRNARFYKNKTGYIVLAREQLSGELRGIKEVIRKNDPAQAREWLVKNIKGLGYKEASHFLRNVGLGNDLAILDVHILRNLAALGVIPEVPKSLTGKKYLEIEGKMKLFAAKTKIPLAHMDLLFWSMATGRIFK